MVARAVGSLLLLSLAAARYPGPNRGYRGMPESERKSYFARNGYTWPPKSGCAGWPPRDVDESETYKESRDQVEAWIRNDLHDFKTRFDEWASLVQSRMMPAFTPHGYEIADFTQLRPELWQQLRANYEKHVMDPVAFDKMSFEGIESSAGALRPKFYYQEALNAQLLESLRPELEKWSGIELQKGRAYGVRVYQNYSTLVLHVDKPETHVISCIVHIGHDLDEPWPLQIEDHDGVWHEHELQPGQMIMYESSKQYHARLRPMNGRHYGSVFLHWRRRRHSNHGTASRATHARAAVVPTVGGRFPKHGWNWTMWDMHVAVPPDATSDGARHEHSTG
jgi:hypothetical protein